MAALAAHRDHREVLGGCRSTVAPGMLSDIVAVERDHRVAARRPGAAGPARRRPGRRQMAGIRSSWMAGTPFFGDPEEAGGSLDGGGAVERGLIEVATAGIAEFRVSRMVRSRELIFNI